MLKGRSTENLTRVVVIRTLSSKGQIWQASKTFNRLAIGKMVLSRLSSIGSQRNLIKVTHRVIIKAAMHFQDRWWTIKNLWLTCVTKSIDKICMAMHTRTRSQVVALRQKSCPIISAKTKGQCSAHSKSSTTYSQKNNLRSLYSISADRTHQTRQIRFERLIEAAKLS